jgi:hypothetical protein
LLRGKKVVFPVHPNLIPRFFHVTEKIVLIGLNKAPQGSVSGAVDILPRNQTASGRRTHRVLDMALFKDNTVFGETLKIGRTDPVITVNA